jgi:hypothetical protein
MNVDRNRYRKKWQGEKEKKRKILKMSRRETTNGHGGKNPIETEVAGEE